MICALLAYSALPAGGRARGEPSDRRQPVRLQTVGPLPFSGAELEEVVSARVPVGVGPDGPLVVVGPAADGGIALRVGDQQTIVAVADRGGLAAARLVAVAIADLFTGSARAIGAATSAGATGAAQIAGTTPARPPAQPPVLAAAALPPAASPESRPQVSVALDISRGLGAAEPVAFGALGDLLLARGRALFGIGLGASRTPTQRPGRPDEASLTTGAARAWGGLRRGGLELLAGPFAAPYQLGGAFSRTGVLAGGGAMLRYRQRIAGRTQLTAALRVDGYFDRFRVSAGDASPSLATPRVAVALDLGLGWDFGR